MTHELDTHRMLLCVSEELGLLRSVVSAYRIASSVDF